MYYFFLIAMFISVILVMMEIVYVFRHQVAKIHSYLLFYLMTVLVNNVGYIFEMMAETSEAAYAATRFLYLGKAFFPLALLYFVLEFCHADIKSWLRTALLSAHAVLYFIILTNEWHHLYYTEMTYVQDGFFPHNIYGHGIFYWIFQATPIVYAIISIIVVIRQFSRMKTSLERKQFKYIMWAQFIALAGLLVFFTGKTDGIDTANIGLAIASVLMIIPIFHYSLTDIAVVAREVIIDSLRDGIVALDAYSNIAYINNSARKLLPGIDMSDKNTYMGIINDLRNKAQGNERIDISNRVYSIRNKKIANSEGEYKGELFVLDDITENVKRTLEIELQRDRADKANAAKNRFIANLSQEIRTPMMSIVGSSEILLRNGLDKKQSEYVTSIRNSGNELVDIISDIFDYSQIESDTFEIVETEYMPGRLFESIKKTFSEKAVMKPVRISYEIDSELPSKLLGDEARIKLVISKLMSNAIKYTEIGFVNVKVSALLKEEGMVNLIISVKDSGQGIRNEELKALFDSSKNVEKKKDQRDGVGLGLKLSSEILKLMGGNIEAHSEYGRGSEFIVTIPQKIVDSTPTDVDSVNAINSTEKFRAPKVNLLVVEDNEINMKVVKELLKPIGMSIDTAENGLVAIKRVSEKHYDLVLMDYMMPVMDGIEATGRIRNMDGEYYKELPIVALTANTTISSKNSFLQAGMNDFLSKPIQMPDMYDVLRRWLPDELIEDCVKVLPNETEDTKINTESAPQNVKESDSRKKEDANMAYGAIDREVGIQYFGSDELYDEILEDFYRLIDAKADKIEELFKEGNIKDYTIEVHALKSTARMIGATELSEMALSMEMAGKENNVDLISEKNPELLKMYRAYKESLAYFDSDAKADDMDKVEVPVNVIKTDLFEMNVATKEFDMDKVDDIMKKLKSYKLPSAEAGDLLGKLDIAVRDVDLDKIREITVALARTL
ncbi:MAG: response regulator [Lachnospiraceae bacterium]|nr:response regulator [Lachnospiraceae bacterium]